MNILRDIIPPERIIRLPENIVPIGDVFLIEVAPSKVPTPEGFSEKVIRKFNLCWRAKPERSYEFYVRDYPERQELTVSRASVLPTAEQRLNERPVRLAHRFMADGFAEPRDQLNIPGDMIVQFPGIGTGEADLFNAIAGDMHQEIDMGDGGDAADLVEAMENNMHEIRISGGDAMAEDAVEEGLVETTNIKLDTRDDQIIEGTYGDFDPLIQGFRMTREEEEKQIYAFIGGDVDGDRVSGVSIRNISVFSTERYDAIQSVSDLVPRTGRFKIVTNLQPWTYGSRVDESCGIPHFAKKSPYYQLLFLREKYLDYDGFIDWEDGGKTMINWEFSDDCRYFTGGMYEMSSDEVDLFVSIPSIKYMSVTARGLPLSFVIENFGRSRLNIRESIIGIDCYVIGTPGDMPAIIKHIRERYQYAEHDEDRHIKLEFDTKGEWFDVNKLWADFLEYHPDNIIVDHWPEKIKLRGDVVMPFDVSILSNPDVGFLISDSGFIGQSCFDDSMIDLPVGSLIYTKHYGIINAAGECASSKFSSGGSMAPGKNIVGFKKLMKTSPDQVPGMLLIDTTISENDMEFIFSCGATSITIASDTVRKCKHITMESIASSMFKYANNPQDIEFTVMSANELTGHKYKYLDRGNSQSHSIWNRMCEILTLSQDHLVNEGSVFHYLGVTLYQLAELMSPTPIMEDVN